MRKGFLRSLSRWVAGAGLAVAPVVLVGQPGLAEEPAVLPQAVAPETGLVDSMPSGDWCQPGKAGRPTLPLLAPVELPSEEPAEGAAPAQEPEAATNAAEPDLPPDTGEAAAKPAGLTDSALAGTAKTDGEVSEPAPAALATDAAPAAHAIAPALPSPSGPAFRLGNLSSWTCWVCKPVKHWHPPCGQFWASGEYLLWWLKETPLPVALLTTGPPDSFGIINAPGTQVLLGGDALDYQPPSGGRLTTGYWFTTDQVLGVEGSIFAVGQADASSSAESNALGQPLLARPVLNAITLQQTSVLVSFPTAFAGTFDTDADCRLWGADVNLRQRLFNGQYSRLDMLYGVRYLNLQEDLSLSQSSRILENGIVPFAGATFGAPNTVNINDTFETVNQFFGGQLGTRMQFNYGRFVVDFLAKVGFGATRQEVRITGFSNIQAPDGTLLAQSAGGLLAVASNIGQYTERDKFAAIPEVGINLGYQLTDRWRMLVGYNFIYWGEVARPGDQINTIINPTLVPTTSVFGPVFGPIQPRPFFNTADFWAQGISLGLAFNY
jgi:hypothetical protein